MSAPSPAATRPSERRERPLPSGVNGSGRRSPAACYLEWKAEVPDLSPIGGSGLRRSTAATTFGRYATISRTCAGASRAVFASLEAAPDWDAGVTAGAAPRRADRSISPGNRVSPSPAKTTGTTRPPNRFITHLAPQELGDQGSPITRGRARHRPRRTTPRNSDRSARHRARRRCETPAIVVEREHAGTATTRLLWTTNRSPRGRTRRIRCIGTTRSERPRHRRELEHRRFRNEAGATAPPDPRWPPLRLRSDSATRDPD